MDYFDARSVPIPQAFADHQNLPVGELPAGGSPGVVEALHDGVVPPATTAPRPATIVEGRVDASVELQGVPVDVYPTAGKPVPERLREDVVPVRPDHPGPHPGGDADRTPLQGVRGHRPGDAAPGPQAVVRPHRVLAGPDEVRVVVLDLQVVQFDAPERLGRHRLDREGRPHLSWRSSPTRSVPASTHPRRVWE